MTPSGRRCALADRQLARGRLVDFAFVNNGRGTREGAVEDIHAVAGDAVDGGSLSPLGIDKVRQAAEVAPGTCAEDAAVANAELLRRKFTKMTTLPLFSATLPPSGLSVRLSRTTWISY